MTPAHWLLLIAVNLAFGLNLVATKFAVTVVPPLAFSALRFALVILVLAPIIRLHRGQMRLLLLLGFLMGTLQFGLLNVGLALAGDVSTVAIVIQLGVPFATLMSVFFLGEVIRWRRMLGIMLAFSGVGIIGFDPRVFNYLDAVALVALSALVTAAGMTIIKARISIDAMQLQAWIAIVAFPTLGLLSVFVEQGQLTSIRHMPPLVAGCLLFSAVGATMLGHGGTYVLLRRYDLSLVTPLLLLSTVFGVVFGVVLLGDVITPKVVTGGVITLAGALFLTLRNRDPAATPVAGQTVVQPRQRR